MRDDVQLGPRSGARGQPGEDQRREHDGTTEHRPPSPRTAGSYHAADRTSVQGGTDGLQLALGRDRLDGLDLLLLGAPAAVALGVARHAHHAGGDRLVPDHDEAADDVALLPADALDVEPVHVHLGALAAPGARLVVLLLGLAHGLHVLRGCVDAHASEGSSASHPDRGLTASPASMPALTGASPLYSRLRGPDARHPRPRALAYGPGRH